MKTNTVKRITLAFAFALALAFPPSAHCQGMLGTYPTPVATDGGVQSGSVQADLLLERGRYGALLDTTEAGALVNAVAWKHRAEGFGLLAKPGGNHCPQPRTGILVSCDWLVNSATGRGWDALTSCAEIGSPGVCTPQFGGDGEDFDRARFVAPVGSSDIPIDIPLPPPPHATIAATSELQQQQIVLLLQLVAKLDTQLEQQRLQAVALEAALRDLKAEIAKGLKFRF